MPEDSNPNLTKASKENFIYFTLPMALNYQRNSYTLWQSALKTWKDKETIKVFDTINIFECSDHSERFMPVVRQDPGTEKY